MLHTHKGVRAGAHTHTHTHTHTRYGFCYEMTRTHRQQRQTSGRPITHAISLMMHSTQTGLKALGWQ